MKSLLALWMGWSLAFVANSESIATQLTALCGFGLATALWIIVATDKGTTS